MPPAFRIFVHLPAGFSFCTRFAACRSLHCLLYLPTPAFPAVAHRNACCVLPSCRFCRFPAFCRYLPACWMPFTVSVLHRSACLLPFCRSAYCCHNAFLLDSAPAAVPAAAFYLCHQQPACVTCLDYRMDTTAFLTCCTVSLPYFCCCRFFYVRLPFCDSLLPPATAAAACIGSAMVMLPVGSSAMPPPRFSFLPAPQWMRRRSLPLPANALVLPGLRGFILPACRFVLGSAILLPAPFSAEQHPAAAGFCLACVSTAAPASVVCVGFTCTVLPHLPSACLPPAVCLYAVSPTRLDCVLLGLPAPAAMPAVLPPYLPFCTTAAYARIPPAFLYAVLPAPPPAACNLRFVSATCRSSGFTATCCLFWITVPAVPAGSARFFPFSAFTVLERRLLLPFTPYCVCVPAVLRLDSAVYYLPAVRTTAACRLPGFSRTYLPPADRRFLVLAVCWMDSPAYLHCAAVHRWFILPFCCRSGPLLPRFTCYTRQFSAWIHRSLLPPPVLLPPAATCCVHFWVSLPFAAATCRLD